MHQPKTNLSLYKLAYCIYVALLQFQVLNIYTEREYQKLKVYNYNIYKIGVEMNNKKYIQVNKKREH